MKNRPPEPPPTRFQPNLQRNPQKPVNPPFKETLSRASERRYYPLHKSVNKASEEIEALLKPGAKKMAGRKTDRYAECGEERGAGANTELALGNVSYSAGGGARGRRGRGKTGRVKKRVRWGFGLRERGGTREVPRGRQGEAAVMAGDGRAVWVWADGRSAGGWRFRTVGRER